MKIGTDVVQLNYMTAVVRLEEAINSGDDAAYAAEKANIGGVLRYMDSVGYEFADAADGSLRVVDAGSGQR